MEEGLRTRYRPLHVMMRPDNEDMIAISQDVSIVMRQETKAGLLCTTVSAKRRDALLTGEYPYARM